MLENVAVVHTRPRQILAQQYSDRLAGNNIYLNYGIGAVIKKNRRIEPLGELYHVGFCY